VSWKGLVVEGAMGRSGMTVFKREGDGATPIGDLALLSGYFRRDRLARPRTAVALAPIRRDAGWCDAPRHPAYNRPIRLPFAASHEEMARADHLYDMVMVLDWNIRSRRRGRGSAIFLHLAKPGFQPTEGCVALMPRAMRRLLAYAGNTAVLRVMR
jgi:L,D-peptidoglycan transpeptidase YkuD (ErfK/YbiS/YcfS/YnhG family)